MIRVYSLLAIFLSFVLGMPNTFAEPSPEQIARVAALIEKAKSRGNVPVIVRLNIPHQIEARLPQASKLAQRTSIANAQANIERLLSARAKDSAKRFTYIPYMAMHVDKGELESLAAHPLITDIVEDKPVPPTLAQSTAVIGASSVWDVSVDGSGWTVAVLDTGVDKNHPFLAGKVVSEACYSSTYSSYGSLSVCPRGSKTASGSGVNCDISGCDHGTHVAGIIAGADYTGGPGYSGVARGTDLISIQVFSQFTTDEYCGPGKSPCVLSYTSDQIAALQRVYQLRGTYNIASVNMSLGDGQHTSYCDGSYGATKTAIDDLRAVGIATVISSGNDGYKSAMGSPGCISSAISVGATCDYTYSGWPGCTGIDAIPSYSNIASFISLLAPGSAIQSSVPGGGYGNWHGTSMAAPHVAGAWALMKQLNPAASVDQVLNDLQNTGVSVDDNRSGGSVTDMRRIHLDSDSDGIITSVDNCPGIANTDQSDVDGDGVGDLCDPDFDSDGDTIPDMTDNCPAIANLDQSDLDGDGEGDVCDADRDGDGIDNTQDNCPDVSNTDQSDIDGDGAGDSCDADMDGDGLTNSQEDSLGTFMDIPDSDGDGLNDGDEVNLHTTSPLDPDTDSDGLLDGEEVTTYGTDPTQSDLGDLAPRGSTDGVLNAGDLVVLSRIVFEQITPTTLESVLADINQDGELNVVDFMLLQQAIINDVPL